ncbi:MAG TPA: hypothetical protein VL371_04255 [Gemmataceae bacterium]|nr:hypothetical protein [Gemmataceae bacterium]
MARYFVPLALDTYFRGNSQELAFCDKIGAGGNHVVVATAGGESLGKGQLKLCQRDLQRPLADYRQLPKDQRTPPLEDPALASPPKRPVPQPPPGGLILRGYCTFLRRDAKGTNYHSTEYYYRENPDRWAAETQSDLLWLTESEWKSLIPANPKAADRSEVARAVQKRFFSTIAIDYMDGSVNSLPTRDATMSLTVQRVDDKSILLRLDGYARLGKELDNDLHSQPNSRGSEIRVLGYVGYDRNKQAITRFDVVGVGDAWGNKMNYLQREIRLNQYPWMYGIACELVTGDSPRDRIPPYNLLHYNATGPYFDGP